MGNPRDGAVVITGGSVTLAFAIEGAFQKIAPETYELKHYYIRQFALTQGGEETHYWVCAPGLEFVFHYQGRSDALTINSDIEGIVIHWPEGTLTGDGPFTWKDGWLSGKLDIEGADIPQVAFRPDQPYQFTLRPAPSPVEVLGTQRVRRTKRRF